MTLANKITLARIVLVPVFIIALLQQWQVAVFLYIPIMLSDCLDGYIARVKKQQTQLGAFLDPMADRLLLIFTFLTLTHQKIIPKWMFVLVLSRDLLVISGWILIFLITNKKDIFPRLSGKIAIILQMFFVLFILINPSALKNPSLTFEDILLYITAAFTGVSIVDYAVYGGRKLSKYG